MSRGHRLPRVRIGEPRFVPMTEHHHDQAVNALSAMIARWWAVGDLRRAGNRPI
jgi:hypothetical protein